MGHRRCGFSNQYGVSDTNLHLREQWVDSCFHDIKKNTDGIYLANVLYDPNPPLMRKYPNPSQVVCNHYEPVQAGVVVTGQDMLVSDVSVGLNYLPIPTFNDNQAVSIDAHLAYLLITRSRLMNDTLRYILFEKRNSKRRMLRW